jgi:hypothetical protein
MTTKIYYPSYIRIVERCPGAWGFRSGKPFYKPPQSSVDIRNPEKAYGLTKKEVTIELFRINGGRLGYYLANLRDRKYYYCGTKWQDVKTTLRQLGIGRDDPMEKDNA